MTTQIKNPFTWVEIYVEDMDRAQKFYETVLQIKMMPMPTPGDISDLLMVSFPWAEGTGNISGALCKNSEMKPGQVLQEKFPIGEHGFCSICMDTEGNIIGLHSMK
jgi:predicted enzyme related to lactoylglutathione lyase